MEVGHKTDVNKDQGVVLSGNNGQTSDGTLAFVLPSYASGITQVHAKPNLSGLPQPGTSNSASLSSGNYNFPSNTKATTSPSTSYTQSAFTSTTNQQPLANYNRFGGDTQQEIHQAPNTNLLPPLAPASSPPPLGSRDSVSFSASNNQQTLLNKGSGQSQGSFIQSTAGQTYQGTTGTNGFVFSTNQNIPQSNKPSTGNIFAGIPAYQSTGTNSNTANQNKNSDRYSGSFGGAPGVLSPYDLGGIKPPPPQKTTTTTTTTVYTTQPTTTTNTYQYQQSFTNSQSSVVTGHNPFIGNTQTTQSQNLGNNPFFGQQQNAIVGQTSTTSAFNNHYHAPIEQTTANYGHNPFLSGNNQITRPQHDIHNHHQNTQTTQTVQQAQPTQQIIAGGNKKENRYSGSFGGPPGVLQPYDNSIDKRFNH